MATLFNRKAEVFFTLPDREITLKGLRVVFSFDKSTATEPNRGNFQVYNLSPNTRNLIEDAVKAGVVAGYEELSKSFEGDISTYTHTKTEEGDTITDIQLIDGLSTSQVEVNETFPAGTTIKAVLESMFSSLGGNPSEVLGNLVGINLDDTIDNGLTVSGNAVNEINNLTKAKGIEWWEDDGILKAIQEGGSLLDKEIVLSEITGLIGRPQKTESGVKIRSLMNTQIVPGIRLDINSEEFKGIVVVESVKHFGDTEENNWFSDMDCRI